MLNDLRLAFRSLRRAPAFTLVVVVTLGLGIGANSAIFSVLNGVLLQPPPFRDMDRLAMVWQTDRASGTTREPASIPDAADFAGMAKTFETMAMFSGADVNAAPAHGDPFRAAALASSYRLLPMLGIQPLAGRTFTIDEDKPGAPRVAIISERMWDREFGRDPDLVRHTIRLNEVPHAIVGVVARTADFGVLQILSSAAYGRSFADRGRQHVEVWLPLRADPAAASRDNHSAFVMGRLAAGVSVSAARDELTHIAADLERSYPESNEARGAFVEPLGDVVLGPIRPALYVLLAAVGLVLLVACVNVVNLLLARSAARAREVAVRTALGAGAWHLTRQFLAEGIVLTAGGAVAGLLLARWVLDALVALAPASIPRIADAGIDAAVLTATSFVTLLIALCVGLVPALQARQAALQNTLKMEPGRTVSAGRSRTRTQAVLLVVQVGLAVVLAIGAGLLIRSFWHLQRVDPGFRADSLLKLEYQLPASRYPQRRDEFPNWPDVRRFHDELIRKASALPGVEGAAIAGDHPLASGFTNSFEVVGREAEARNWPEISVRFISAGYLRTTGLPLRAGRPLRDSDDVRAPAVVLINESARQRFFPRQDPIGQQLAFWGARRSIVGVVGNETIHGLDKGTPPAAYVPLNQAPLAGTLLVRVAGDPAAIAPGLRGIVREIDPSLAVFGVEPLAGTIASSLRERRFTMLVLASFAGLTLVLAGVGVYGVLSYGVAQRTGEIGIRMALGARSVNVLRLIVGRAMVLVAAGVAAGIAGAMLLTRLLGTLLFGITPTDPLTFAATPLLLLVVAAVASYVPARRASRVDPLVALRLE